MLRRWPNGDTASPGARQCEQCQQFSGEHCQLRSCRAPSPGFRTFLLPKKLLVLFAAHPPLLRMRRFSLSIPWTAILLITCTKSDENYYPVVATAPRVFIIQLPITYPSVPVTIPPNTSAT